MAHAVEAPDMQTQTSYAGFWIRFVAYIIDGIILGIVTFPLGIIFPAVTMDGVIPIMNTTNMMITQVLSVAIFLGYFIFMEGSKATTIGKMALGLTIIDESGNPITMGKAVPRNLGKIVSSLILMIGYIMAGFDPRKQALHDKLAKTFVVKK